MSCKSNLYMFPRMLFVTVFIIVALLNLPYTGLLHVWYFTYIISWIFAIICNRYTYHCHEYVVFAFLTSKLLSYTQRWLYFRIWMLACDTIWPIRMQDSFSHMIDSRGITWSDLDHISKWDAIFRCGQNSQTKEIFFLLKCLRGNNIKLWLWKIVMMMVIVMNLLGEGGEN